MALVEGTVGDDTLSGSRHKDRIYGLEGDDVLNGLGGDDLLTGGSGKDALFGGEGRDTLIGGQDKDMLDGGAGDDLLIDADWGGDHLHGGDGNDVVSVSRDRADLRNPVGLYGEDGADRLTFAGPADRSYIGEVVLEGGAGNDILRASWYEARLYAGGLFGQDGDDRVAAKHVSQVQLYGGAGDDVLRLSKSDFAAILAEDGDDILIASKLNHGNLNGGAGNDSFVVTGRSEGGVSVQTGPGDHLITVDDLASKSLSVTLGDGHDEITVLGTRAHLKPGDMYVIGFTPGDSGDRVLLADYLEHTLVGWDGTTDPFAAGYLRLEHEPHRQTLLQVDVDGSGAGSDWKILVRFSEHEDILDELTAYNFGGYDPELMAT